MVLIEGYTIPVETLIMRNAMISEVIGWKKDIRTKAR